MKKLGAAAAGKPATLLALAALATLASAMPAAAHDARPLSIAIVGQGEDL